MRYHLSGPEVCRAVDVGYGFVKFTKSHTAVDWTVDADAFPSLAPEAPAYLDVSGGESQRHNIAVIDVDGMKYAVGPDAMFVAPALFTRLLDASFFKSEQYLALYRGALYYMEIPPHGVIDFMTVGLPYTVFQDVSLRAEVQARLSGWHDLPARFGQRTAQRVMVRNVRVIPQVMGSLLAQTIPNNTYARIQNEINLTIDVGYGTLLWMVSTGTKPDTTRCAGSLGGVSSVLQAVAAAIDPQLMHDPRILERLDRGLRNTGSVVKIGGKPVDLSRYQRTISRVLREWVASLMRSLGGTQDVDNVYLSGGGAYLYKDLIKAAFADLTVTVDESNGRFTNVRGYQMAAERRAVDARSVTRAAA